MKNPKCLKANNDEKKWNRNQLPKVKAMIKVKNWSSEFRWYYVCGKTYNDNDNFMPVDNTNSEWSAIYFVLHLWALEVCHNTIGNMLHCSHLCDVQCFLQIYDFTLFQVLVQKKGYFLSSTFNKLYIVLDKLAKKKTDIYIITPPPKRKEANVSHTGTLCTSGVNYTITHQEVDGSVSILWHIHHLVNGYDYN